MGFNRINSVVYKSYVRTYVRTKITYHLSVSVVCVCCLCLLCFALFFPPTTVRDTKFVRDIFQFVRPYATIQHFLLPFLAMFFFWLLFCIVIYILSRSLTCK